jgi:hypothetical protein
MLSRVKKFVKGEQAQAAYEIEHADSIHRAEEEAFEQEMKRRSTDRRKTEAVMREAAEQKAIESAKRRGARKATPLGEQINDNFDEALEKAMAGAKKVQEKAITGAKKAQEFIESPGVQKKFSNARHNLGNVGGDLKKIVQPPREPARKQVRGRGRGRQIPQRVQIVEKAVVREHPVHAKKDKPQVGNPNKGRFGVRSSSREKAIIGNPNKKNFGVISSSREQPTLRNVNKGIFGVKSSKTREEHRFGTRSSRR